MSNELAVKEESAPSRVEKAADAASLVPCPDALMSWLDSSDALDAVAQRFTQVREDMDRMFEQLCPIVRSLRTLWWRIAQRVTSQAAVWVVGGHQPNALQTECEEAARAIDDVVVYVRDVACVSKSTPH